VPGFYYGSYYFSTVAEVTKKHFFTSCRNPNLLATLLTTHNFSKTSNHKPQTTASMNFFLFALLFLLLVASTAAATRKQWSGNVKMQIKRQAGATSQCSDQAMQTLNENISDFLHNELVTLIGREDAFSLGVVRGVADGDSLSLNAGFDCLDCGTAPDKDSIAQILMFFMQRRKDAWLPDSDSSITEGCVDSEASVSHIMVIETVSIAPVQPLVFIEASTTASLFSSRLNISSQIAS
jgi:hypothetical protein